MALVDESIAVDASEPALREPATGTGPHAHASGTGAPSEVTVNLFDTVQKVLRGRALMVWLTLAGVLLGVGVYAITRPFFFAEATFLPPQQQPSSGFSALGSLLQSQSQTDSTDTYLALLQSRSVLDDVVDQVHAMNRFQTSSRLVARVRIAEMSRFGVNKNQVLTVTVKSGDPGFAAEVANAFLEALYRQNGRMVTSASSHREQFFQGQLKQQREELTQAENNLQKTQERTGLVLPEGEANAGIAATAQLQQQITEAESRLSGLLAGATEQNPEVVQQRKQIAALRAALSRQQAATGVRRPGGGLASTSVLPELTMQNLERQRDLKLQEALFQSLTQQYEQARLGSVDPGPQLQIIDRAIRPELKAGPRARVYAFSGGAIGFFVALAYLLLAEPLRKLFRSYREHTRTGVLQG